MCDCIPSSQRSRGELHPGWLSGGRVVHPDAPAGGGGAGLFRLPGSTGTGGGSALLPHPDAPAAGDLDPRRLDAAQGEVDKEKKRLPAPVVERESTQTVQGMTVLLLPDLQGVPGVGSATTLLDESEGGASYVHDKGTGKVLTVTVVPWKVTIQTCYGTGDANADAAYGRGTTDDDIKAGRITLGFHESCHRDDLIAYLKQHAPPTFAEMVGKPKAEADAEIARYKTASKAYFKAARAHSEAVTDETGKPKRSEYLAAQAAAKKK
ncbi:MAG: hypothetical protein IPM99_05045 [Rubrivivax sp.]|nr:hypothetical protein [Rubrivivax sp.]